MEITQYGKCRKTSNSSLEPDGIGDGIPKEEFEVAEKKLKDRKAPRVNSIQAEVIPSWRSDKGGE